MEHRWCSCLPIFIFTPGQAMRLRHTGAAQHSALALFSLRILISLSLPRGVLRSITSGALLTLFLSSVLAYYALVLIGPAFLGARNHMAVNRDLFRSIVRLAAGVGPVSCSDLRIDRVSDFAGFLVHRSRVETWGWVDALSRYASRLAGVLFALLGLALASYLIVSVRRQPRDRQRRAGQPDVLPGLCSHRLQSNATGRGAALDVVERAAREAYTQIEMRIGGTCFFSSAMHCALTIWGSTDMVATRRPISPSWSVREARQGFWNDFGMLGVGLRDSWR